MRFLAIALLATIPTLTMGQPKTKPSPQAERGRELFLKSPKGVPCSTCHTLIGLGTAVGPDLTKMGSFAMPKGFVTAMKMSMTENVLVVKPQTGDPFPGILKQKTGDKMELYDLSQLPPVLRTFEAGQLPSITRDDKWKHPPISAGYTSSELADIVGFVKWASTGSTKEIKVEDIETSQ
jgi:hypothetical protein